MPYKGVGEKFGLPWQTHKEPLIGEQNETQNKAIENLFYVLFKLLDIVGRDFIIEDGEYELIDGDGLDNLFVKLSHFEFFCENRLCKGDDVKWPISPGKTNYLYICLKPMNAGICYTDKFFLRVEPGNVGGRLTMLFAVVRFENGKYILDTNPEGKAILTNG
jgi:hypothetical protein